MCGGPGAISHLYGPVHYFQIICWDGDQFIFTCLVQLGNRSITSQLKAMPKSMFQPSRLASSSSASERPSSSTVVGPPPTNISHILAVHVVSHDCNECCWSWSESDDEVHLEVRHLFRDKPTFCDGRSRYVQDRLLSKTTNFQILCRQVKQVLRDHEHARLVLNFWCNAGKHRSVACTEVFAGIFRRVLGLDVSVEHRSLLKHNRACGCKECNSESQVRQVAIDLFESA